MFTRRGTPKTWTISKIVIYSMISSSWNSVNDVSPPRFFWGAMLLFQRSNRICRFHGARETPNVGSFLFFPSNIRSFRRQVLNCQLHVGLAPTEFTISEVGSIDDVRCGFSRVSRNGIRPFFNQRIPGVSEVFFFSGEPHLGSFQEWLHQGRISLVS